MIHNGPTWLGALSIAVVGVTMLLGFVWWLRARAMRRRETALDVYAEREIAEYQRNKRHRPMVFRSPRGRSEEKSRP
jgi:hypothetical protein